MGDVVTALTATGSSGLGDNAVTAANLWGVAMNAVGLIALGILFGFGIRLMRKVLRKITKGTGGF